MAERERGREIHENVKKFCLSICLCAADQNPELRSIEWKPINHEAHRHRKARMMLLFAQIQMESIVCVDGM